MDGPSPASSDSRRKRRRLSDNHAARRTSEAASSAGELGSMRRGLSKDSSSFIGSGSGIYFVRTVQAAFARNRSRSGSEAIEGDIVPGEDDRLKSRGGSTSLWNPDEVEHVDGPSGVSFEELVQWSQPYFDNWHPPFPFLLGSKVLRLFERVALESIESLDSNDDIIVRSILSISVADRRQMPICKQRLVPSHLVFATIDEAITCTTPLLRQASTLSGLQALTAIQLFLISMLHLNAASRIGGLIMRIAVQLGLHRCPSRYDQFSSSDRDIRRRVFWTIYTFERYLSQALGLPLDLGDDDIDVCFADHELHVVDNRQTKEVTNHDPRLLLFPTFLARHGKIRGLILQLRHISMTNRTTDPDEVAYVESEISKWWNEAQDLLDPHFHDVEETADLPNGRKDDLLKSSHKLLLVVQKHESTILLNRPLMAARSNTAQFSSAMQKCIGASKQIVSKVYQHLHGGISEVVSSEVRLHSPLFWPGFTWAVWMSGLILLYAAAERHYSVQIAQREAERCVRILETLSLRGSFWPGACASALKDLRKALVHKSAVGSAISVSENQSVQRPSNNQAFEEISTPTDLDTTSIVSRPESGIEFSTIPDVAFHHQIPHNYCPSQPLPSTQNMQDPTQRSEKQGLLHPNQDNFRVPMDFNFGDWHGVGITPTFGDGNYDGFNDIFQLMDVSYQISEQMFEPMNNYTPRF